jgi:hydrogenase expression/formation protein HypD
MILDGYRDPVLARKLKARINSLASGLDSMRIMHVCGTHEWTITHFGIRSLLPENVEVRAGPGCPVCVTPAADIDAAVNLALNGKTVVTYGDMSRAKGSTMSLTDAKSAGGDLKIVYSVHDAVELAKKRPEKEHVFFAVGFETTAPSTAYEIVNIPPQNLTFLTSYRYVPPAVGTMATSPMLRIDGFINAGHASTITGMRAYEPYFDVSRKPMVFSGFEPIDLLITIAMLLQQVKSKEPKLENEYTRAVTWEGNVKAQQIMDRVFEMTDGYWRGVSVIPGSGYKFREKFSEYDARIRYGLKESPPKEQFVAAAKCSGVIMGAVDPPECSLYMKECTSDSPKGPPMVSTEGTCRIWAQHKIMSSFRCRI